MSASTWPTSSPSTREKGRREGSMATTSTPSWHSDADTSEPMKLKPITTARRPGPAAARMRSQSASVRSWKTPARFAPGAEKVRLRPPVVTSRRSYRTRSPPSSSTSFCFVSIAVARAELELDTLLGVVARRLHELILEAVLPAQIALRQRRSVVGQLRLGADQDDVAIESFFAQGDGGRAARQRSAD